MQPSVAVDQAGTERATIEAWLAIPEEERAELIGGRIVRYAPSGPAHGFTHGNIFAALLPTYGRSGGWWFSQRVDMALAHVGCRPDVLGWRKDRYPALPEPDARGVVTAVPDFICEVFSPSSVAYDLGAKREAYFEAGVPHYWVVDPAYKILTVLERTERGYTILLVATGSDVVRAAPFEGVEIVVSELFADGAARTA